MPRRRLNAARCFAALGSLLLLWLFTSGSGAAARIDDSVERGTLGSWHYAGPWAHVRGVRDGRSGGTSTRSATRGAAAALSFRGTGVRLYGVRGPAGGFARVELDGGSPRTIDFHAYHVTPHALVTAFAGLKNGEHTVTVTVEGQRLQSSFGKFVNIDEAEIDTPSVISKASPPPRIARTPSAPHISKTSARVISKAPPHAVASQSPLLSAQHPATAPRDEEPALQRMVGQVLRAPLTDRGAGIVRIVVMLLVVGVAVLVRNVTTAKRDASHDWDAPITWPERFGTELPAAEPLRRQLLQSIGESRFTPTEHDLDDAFTQEREPEMRLAVLRAIRDGAYAAGHLPLMRATEDPDERVRAMAAEGFARLRDFTSVETLLSDRSYSVALAAAYQLAQAYGTARATEVVTQRTTVHRSTAITKTLQALS